MSEPANERRDRGPVVDATPDREGALRYVERNAVGQEIVYVERELLTEPGLKNAWAQMAGRPEPYEIRYLAAPKNVTPSDGLPE